jgi:hypothetical protein
MGRELRYNTSASIATSNEQRNMEMGEHIHDMVISRHNGEIGYEEFNLTVDDLIKKDQATKITGRTKIPFWRPYPYTHGLRSRRQVQDFYIS